MNRIIKVWLIVFTAVILLLLVTVPLVGGRYVPKIINSGALPKDKADAIIVAEQGYYNLHLPLFATKIEFIEITEDYLIYRVHYFPFGNIERSYTREPDGNWIFNLEKPLFGIS